MNTQEELYKRLTEDLARHGVDLSQSTVLEELFVKPCVDKKTMSIKYISLDEYMKNWPMSPISFYKESIKK